MLRHAIILEIVKQMIAIVDDQKNYFKKRKMSEHHRICKSSLHKLEDIQDILTSSKYRWGRSFNIRRWIKQVNPEIFIGSFDVHHKETDETADIIYQRQIKFYDLYHNMLMEIHSMDW
jgi:hypothetical protein